MSEQTLRPGNIAAAAVVIGGVFVVLLPQHGMSIVRLVIVTVAAAAALYALGVNAPATWWRSPFDRRRRYGRRVSVSDEIGRIRSDFTGWRQRVPGAPPLPPDVLRLLKPVIVSSLERAGIDAGDASPSSSVRARLSPLTRAVMAAEPLRSPNWLRMVRPDGREVAVVVRRIMDELDRLGNGEPGRQIETRNPGAT